MRTGASCRPSSTASTALSSTHPARARRPRLPARSPLARRAAPELQLALLRAAIARVRPGGAVVYSTCTLNAEENEAVVDAVAGEGLATIDPTLGDEWPAFRHRSRPGLLQTLPHLHATGGFFVARLLVR